jgi:hypothetical protein
MLSVRLTFCLVGLSEGAQQADPVPTLTDQITAIQREYEQRQRQFYDELRAAGRDDAKVSAANDEWRTFVRVRADRLKDLIRAHPNDAEVFEGILVLAGTVRWPLDGDLVRLVLERHRDNPKMGQLCFDLRGRSRESWAERIIGATAERHPLPGVRGQALYALAEYNRCRALPVAGNPRPDPADAERWLAQAERDYTEVVRNSSEFRTPDGKAKLGDLATAELARLRNLPNLVAGKPAPTISGEDLDGKPFTLSDYAGKVVVLDFWGHW